MQSIGLSGSSDPSPQGQYLTCCSHLSQVHYEDSPVHLEEIFRRLAEVDRHGITREKVRLQSGTHTYVVLVTTATCTHMYICNIER